MMCDTNGPGSEVLVGGARVGLYLSSVPSNDIAQALVKVEGRVAENGVKAVQCTWGVYVRIQV